jgi:uncharacterized protein YbjT (DUF2867 family)
MKVLLLGATGGTGREIVKRATAKGHSVVAVVRSIAKAGDLAGATLVQGDARDEALLARALEGCTGVISSIGTSVSPFKEVTLLSTVTRSLVKEMTQKGVRRLVCITGLGAGDSQGHGGFVFDNIIMPLLLRKVYDDKNRQEDLVRASGLDWVLVRPVVLNDKVGTGKVRADTDLSGIHGGSIARADVAQFVVDQLTEDRWLHHAPLIRES